MDNQKSILSGNIEDLKGVSGRLEKLEQLDRQLARVRLDKQRLEKDVEAEEKLLADNIEATIKKRREELTATYDKEIEKDQDRLKTIRSNREKAKNKGIKERIILETDSLSMENRRIHEEIRTVFKQKGISRSCDSKLFYALYYPKGMLERLITLLVWAIALVGLPFTVFAVLKWTRWIEIVLWVFVAIVFIAIYIGIRMKTKDIHHTTFMEMRKNRNIIDKNLKKIREIKRNIKKDKDEEHYKLDRFDAEAAKIEEAINQEAARKSRALADFDENMRPIIIEEITNQDKDRISELKDKLLVLSKQSLELETSSKELRTDIITEYASYVGIEFMTAENTQVLISIMEEGRASTVQEAREQYYKE